MNSETIGKFIWRGLIAAMIVGGLYAYFFPGDFRKTAIYQCYERRRHELRLPHELDQNDDIMYSIIVWCQERDVDGRPRLFQDQDRLRAQKSN
jgi:hypothetical protein